MNKTNDGNAPSNTIGGTKLMDNIINNYGYGCHTWKVYILVLFIVAVEGFHFSFGGDMIIPLKQFYEMEDSHIQLINSIFFLAVGSGSISIGFLSKRFKRINIIATMLFFITACHISLAFITHLIVFATVRVLLAIFNGIAIPLALNLLTEYLPLRLRAVLLTSVWTGFKLGALFNIFLMLFIMPNNETTMYQETVLYSSSLSIFALIMTILFLNDSPRNLILIGDADKAFKILTKLNRGVELTEEQKEQILNEAKTNDKTTGGLNIAEIFSPSYRRISICLIFIWFTNSLMLYGPALINPLTMKTLGIKSEHIIINQIIIKVVSLPGNTLGGLTSEIPLMGRNKTTILSNLLMIVFTIILIIDYSNFEFYSGLFFLVVAISFNVRITYSCEIYPTKVRDSAMGFLYTCTRIGGFLSQIVFINFNEMGVWVPYYFIIGFCVFNIICTALLPYDTYARELDKEEVTGGRVGLDGKEESLEQPLSEKII
jgi:AAHS family 4-hydroxybenzoate transporter-like MFS transporter